MFKTKLVLTLLATTILLSVSAKAQARITDATGDFLSSYSGAKNGDMDVVSSDVIFDGTGFTLTTTLAGAVGTTTDAIYVWGFDRGQGTARFNAAPLNLNGVLFDSVVILNPATTTVTVNRIVGGGSTTLPSGTAIINGNTISARIAATELPSLGFNANNYTWNLWPRLNGGDTTRISDFAPNNSNAAVVAVPEASSALLLLPTLCGGIGLLVVRRRSNPS